MYMIDELISLGYCCNVPMYYVSKMIDYPFNIRLLTGIAVPRREFT